MSYDLFFDVGRNLDRKQFAAYFRGRRHYEVGNGQAIYRNDDTGVYFVFDEPEEQTVAFNLNFYRPHIFGLEAAIELEAFAKATGAPAGDESGDAGPFDKRKFLHNWNHGNRFACRSMTDDGDTPHTWPAKRIREVWLWNYTRPVQDNWKDGDTFVPAIFPLAINGQPNSVTTWVPHCPILLPAVDAVMLPVDANDEDNEQQALVAWDQVLPLVKPHEDKADGLARYRLTFDDDWPAELEAFWARKRKPMKDAVGIPFDELLDRELVQQPPAD